MERRRRVFSSKESEEPAKGRDMILANQQQPDEEAMLGMLAEVAVLRSTVQQLQTVVLTLLNTLEAAPSEPAPQLTCERGQRAESRKRRSGAMRRPPE